MKLTNEVRARYKQLSGRELPEWSKEESEKILKLAKARGKSGLWIVMVYIMEYAHKHNVTYQQALRDLN